jgi:hypothetical protein
MSWLYSQALVEEYSGGISWDGEQSVQSSGNPTQQAYLSPDKMTEYSRLSRFGMIFKPLTEDRGKALCKLYREAFLARTSLPQEKAQGLTESDQECGEKWRGSFTKYDPDSSSWKTHQCSLLGDLDEFSETWPKWGLMRDGECWEQQMSAHRTSETESGFVPDGETFFHTPNTTGMDGGSNSRKALRKRKEMWPTPVKSDSQARRPSKGWKGDSDLPSVVWKVDGGIENPEKPPAQLNADWVEWLMGWPLGWTDLKPLEMDKFQKWQEQHGRH